MNSDMIDNVKDHAGDVVAAKKHFIESAREDMPRATIAQLEQMLDVMMARKHLSNKFFEDWA